MSWGSFPGCLVTLVIPTNDNPHELAPEEGMDLHDLGAVEEEAARALADMARDTIRTRSSPGEARESGRGRLRTKAPRPLGSFDL
ncbi:DUF6894 family protein (plasmid) [Bradyrhizobium sp. PMVTL-01]|uniref:DUF6894 family protein n=1 Tax=Bradyrhizobium sp. PMVTL-01 TaxID=3434999 RepID=UPI003F717870